MPLRIVLLLTFICAFAASCDDGGSKAPEHTPDALGTATGAGQTGTFTSGVAAGDVTKESAVLWSRAEGGDSILVEVAGDAEFGGELLRISTTTQPAFDFTVHVRAEGLAPDTAYFYRFRSGGNVSPTGSFRTAPADTVSKPLRFVFSGDSDGSRKADGSPPYNEFNVLDAATAENPAFFLYFGDTIYADRDPVASTLSGYRSKYRENRGYPALARLLAQTSTYNTWDDHEVVNDFAGKTVDRAMFEAGRQAFREYMPIDDSAGDPATMYRAFRWGKDVDLIALDERSFRDGSASAACAGDALPGVLAPGVPPIYRAGRAILKLPDAIPPACLDTLNE